jgi:raffinose/stachyose/melibiose transport system permease protein
MSATPIIETGTPVEPPRSGRHHHRRDDDRGNRSAARTNPPRLLKFGHWWWALPGVLFVLAIHYVATSIGGFFAFTDWSGIGGFDIIGLDNFVAIFEDPTKIGALGNTLFLAFGAVILSNIAGLALGLGLNRGLKTRYILRVLFFMPVVLSPLAVSYIWKFIFDFNGPINIVLRSLGLEEFAKSWLADPAYAIWTILIVLVWQNTGIAMVIYMAGLAAVPVEIEEAAAIDGANLWQRFWNVTLPAIRPAVAIATTLGLVNGLRVFDQIMALTGGGPAGATETLATQVYKQSFALGNFGYGAALALLLTVIILVFAIVQQRVAAGGSKEK